jgi:hypothetical protein
MTYQFTDTIVDHSQGTPILISGINSLNLDKKEYLLITDANIPKNVFEIRYLAHCSPFKEALKIDNILAVGHEEHFYLYDLVANRNILTLNIYGYFGNINFNEGYFYVADASSIYCIDKKGVVIWENTNLGIDGVIINDFSENEIIGSGEWDPPNGWRKFKLDKKTGVEKIDS